MAQYILENSAESQRLEQQSKNEQFNLSKEISHLDFSKCKSVLDAGCGSGLLGRYLQDLYPSIKYSGCDQSLERIKFAKENNPKELNFFQADLYDEDFTKEKYDLIITRYVLHHLETPKKMLANLKNRLNPNGRIVIVDVDGLMMNIGTENDFLLKSLEKIKSGFAGSLNGGRKWPVLLHELEFKDMEYRIDVMDFQKNNRALEVEQFDQRLEFAKPMLSQILGSEFEFVRFKKEYLEEIKKEHVPFFYNRFVIEAKI